MATLTPRMPQAFHYRITGTVPELKVKIWQHDWPLLTKALLWSAGCTVIAYSCLKLLTPGALPIILVFMAALLCLGGLVVANLAVQWSTLWLTAESIRLRRVGLFTWRTVFLLPQAIRSFGYGFFSHGGPVLRLDVNGTWLVLAFGVREDKVSELLAEIKKRGYSFPNRSPEEQISSSSVPSFWTLR
jgi:hypothetical protein